MPFSFFLILYLFYDYILFYKSIYISFRRLSRYYSFAQWTVSIRVTKDGYIKNPTKTVNLLKDSKMILTGVGYRRSATITTENARDLPGCDIQYWRRGTSAIHQG